MKPLRALVVEDSEDDVELLLQELRRGGYSPDHIRVDTPETMSAELKKGNWDIVYADFTMPRFNAFAALALLHDTGLDIPFIIVSGTIGEDRAVTAMKAGAHDYILKDNMKRLVPATERELRDMLVRRERKEANETIYRFAYTDLITNLPNRILFHEKAEKAVKDTERGQYSMALLLMDLDRFKDVNDTLGHDQGDALLKKIGQRLQNVLVAPNIVARIGGDEFGILLPRIAAADDVRNIIKKLLDTLKAPFIINKIPIVAEVSIGVAMMPEHANDADKLLQMADIAMYHAKNMSDDYAFYEASYNLNSPERLGLMSELRDAIEQNQLVLHYQPKVETKTNRIVGVEALVRWQHPRLGLLYPDKFIMVAETTGLITPLTKWVLTEALHYCKKQSNEGKHLRVSVNLSARSLHDSQLLKMVADALEITGVDPNQLMLEITESSIVLDPKRAEKSLELLSNMGVQLSIDDFGTGYTSLASIKHLPINEIKIDRSFITTMLKDQKNAMIVRSVIELGRNFGLTVVAEGVETQEVFDALVALGSDEVQGYFICRPQACAILNDWFSTSSWKNNEHPYKS